jgi:hypothetical protein
MPHRQRVVGTHGTPAPTGPPAGRWMAVADALAMAWPSFALQGLLRALRTNRRPTTDLLARAEAADRTGMPSPEHADPNSRSEPTASEMLLDSVHLELVTTAAEPVVMGERR